MKTLVKIALGAGLLFLVLNQVSSARPLIEAPAQARPADLPVR